MKIKFLSLFAFLSIILFTNHLLGQQIVVSGIINDADTGQPVPFANIGIMGKALGTVTNVSGEYELHLPKQHVSDTLVVSCIGYYNQKIMVGNIPAGSPYDVLLKNRTYNLLEITVRPEELTAKQILQKAMKRISDNYIVEPALMDGFYREYFEENGKYVAFAEAGVSIYDEVGYTPHKQKEKETIKINQLRVSDILNKGEYVLYIDLDYALRGNLVRNAALWQTYAKKSNLKMMRLEMDSLSVFDDAPVYCISYGLANEKRGSYKGRLFIRTTDFAVLRIEMDAENALKGRDANGAPYESRSVMVFKNHGDRLYLHYVNASHKSLYEVDEGKFELAFHSELIINDIATGKVEPIPVNAKVKEASIFYQPRYRTYDPDFWSTYTLFKNSPVNEQIIQDLEEKRPLEEQYKDHGKLQISKNSRRQSQRISYPGKW